MAWTSSKALALRSELYLVTVPQIVLLSRSFQGVLVSNYKIICAQYSGNLGPLASEPHADMQDTVFQLVFAGGD